MNEPGLQVNQEESPEPETAETGPHAEHATPEADPSPVDSPVEEFAALPEELVAAIPEEKRSTGPVREALSELDERLAGGEEDAEATGVPDGDEEDSQPGGSGGDSGEVPPALRNERAAVEGRSAGELIRMGYSGRG